MKNIGKEWQGKNKKDRNWCIKICYSMLFYIQFNIQGYTATSTLQIEEIGAYCTVTYQASTSNYQLSIMMSLDRDSTGGLRGWRQEL